MKEQELRFELPRRVEVGPFEDFEVPGQEQAEEIGLTEVDRDPVEGWVWMVQMKRLASRRAQTIMARVRRPGTEDWEKLRLVLVCEGGMSGASS